ncbi:MAG: hypothetical protein ACKV2T_19900 [Kofleriaceae bacterium]
MCCHRPSYPPPQPSSFHFVYNSSPTYWDSILGLSASYPNVTFVGQAPATGVSRDRWVAYVSYRSNPQPTAADINRLLVDPATAPTFVMVEELHDAASQAYFIALANEMRTRYPQWAGRWGAFLSFGNYPVLQDGINALLDANAIISLELYPSKASYCAAGSTGGARDIWLSEQFIGNASLGRLNWLLARRAGRGSQSYITPLFGVGDVLVGETNGAIFLDRMFYVWATRTGHRNMILAANGGPGAYKWQTVAETPAGYGINNTSRDLAFAQSFQHYSVAGLTTSRLGPVPCP